MESLELIVIGVIVLFLIVRQYSMYRQCKENVQILQEVFHEDSSRYIRCNVYIPKDELKNITWEKILNKWERYINFQDTVITDPDGEADVLVRASEKVEVPVIRLINDENQVSANIEKSINTYLLKNRGAVSDFNLIKDIVERNCDAEDHQIEALVPMPLYLGLMGTVVGIIVGLGLLSLNSGFEGGGIMGSVNALLTDVAIAMIASFCGILFTMLSSLKSKECNSTCEARKNIFYTWIQTELLPVLSSNTVSTLTLLERNLTNFNNSFAQIVTKLETKLAQVGGMYQQQIELLSVVRQLDINQMATANVKVLNSLSKSAGYLENFEEYLENTTEYLEQVRKLSNKLDKHSARTEALLSIADFYKQYGDEIKARQSALGQAVVSVDDALKSSLVNLKETSQRELTSLQQTFLSQNEAMEKMAASQANNLVDKLNKLDVAIRAIEQLGPIAQQMKSMTQASLDQAKAITKLSDAIKKMKVVQSTSSDSFLGKFFKRKNKDNVDKVNPLQKHNVPKRIDHV